MDVAELVARQAIPPTVVSVSPSTQPGGASVPSSSTTSPVASPATSSLTTSSSARSSSAASVPTNGTVSSNHGVGSSAAAGIAIGCFAAGALIAAALFFLFCGSKRRSKNADHSKAQLEMSNLKTGSIPLATTSAAAIVEGNLPQSMADSNIAKEVSSIDTAITNFVLSYFTGGQPGPEAVVKAANDATTLDRPLPGQTTANLLANPAHRPAALRLLVASILLPRTEPSSPPDRSLLPPGVASIVSSIPRTASGDPIHSAFLSKWRTISSYLLHSAPNPQDPQLKANALRAMQDIEAVISPFASSQFSQQQRLSTLEGIVNRVVHLAFTLFSQSASWKFTWSATDGQEGTNRVVVFPGLQKVADEDGRQLIPPSTLEHSKVA